MSSAATTDIAICTRALVLIGAEPITSFEDGTTESIAASTLYEDAARTALTSTRWRFATNQATLNRLSDAPTGNWDAAYQLPSGLLLVNSVTVNDDPIRYDIYGSKVFCDATASETLICDYTFRADEANWPPYFTMAVAYRLASIFAVPVARDTNLSNALGQQAELYMARARAADAQQQTTRRLATSRFINQRRS